MTSDTAPGGGGIKAQEVMDSELKDTIQGWVSGGRVEEMAVLWTEKRRRCFLHQTPSHCDTRSGRRTGAWGPAGELKPRLGVVAKQQFTLQSENCPTSGLRCARMSLCCISTVAQKGQAGLYLLKLWDATKSYTPNLLVKWNFYKKTFVLKSLNLWLFQAQYTPVQKELKCQGTEVDTLSPLDLWCIDGFTCLHQFTRQVDTVTSRGRTAGVPLLKTLSGGLLIFYQITFQIQNSKHPICPP